MSQLEYLVALISIIVGLGLTDLAQSFRELIRPGHSVRWDGLPLAWSALVFLTTILVWWNGFGVLEGTGDAGGTGPIFLSYLLIFFLLYLCCAFSLPDSSWGRASDSSERGVDLEAFYFSVEHRRWFFGLLIGFWIVIGVINQFTIEGGVGRRLNSALPIAGTVALTAVPLGTDRRWAHWTAVTVVVGMIGSLAVSRILL